MTRLSFVVLLFVTLHSCGGCTTSAARIDCWVRGQGGIGSDRGRQARVDRVARWVGVDALEEPIRASVLDNEGVAAYGWRGGRLFVTRGLVDLLDDQELAAAIAHELGHQVDEGNARPVAGLRGCEAEADLACEARADRLGVGLLERQHIAAEAMPRMLAKVARAAALDGPCRDALRRRIELLRPIHP